MALPSPGMVAGVGLGGRDDFEGRIANCSSSCPQSGCLLPVAHLCNPSKDGQPHDPSLHSPMNKKPKSEPSSPPKMALKNTVDLSQICSTRNQGAAVFTKEKSV